MNAEDVNDPRYLNSYNSINDIKAFSIYMKNFLDLDKFCFPVEHKMLQEKIFKVRNDFVILITPLVKTAEKFILNLLFVVVRRRLRVREAKRECRAHAVIFLKHAHDIRMCFLFVDKRNNKKRKFFFTSLLIKYFVLKQFLFRNEWIKKFLRRNR